MGPGVNGEPGIDHAIDARRTEEVGQPQGVAPTMSLADGVKQRGWPPFPGKSWQRNYHEHIVRDEETDRLLGEIIGDSGE